MAEERGGELRPVGRGSVRLCRQGAVGGARRAERRTGRKGRLYLGAAWAGRKCRIQGTRCPNIAKREAAAPLSPAEICKDVEAFRAETANERKAALVDKDANPVSRVTKMLQHRLQMLLKLWSGPYRGDNKIANHARLRYLLLPCAAHQYKPGLQPITGICSK